MDITSFYDIKLCQVKGVLLDLDNTLYSYNYCHHIAINNCRSMLLTHLNISSDEFDKHLINSKKRVKAELIGTASSHSRFIYFQKMLESFTGKTQIDLTMELEKHYWDSYIASMEIEKSALGFLETCKMNNVEIVIVTDLTAKIQFLKLKKLGIQKYISFVVTSEEAGVEKPHPYIFQLALEKLKMAVSEVIMIGDNNSKDIFGSELLGIKSFLVEQ